MGKPSIMFTSLSVGDSDAARYSNSFVRNTLGEAFGSIVDSETLQDLSIALCEVMTNAHKHGRDRQIKVFVALVSSSQGDEFSCWIRAESHSKYRLDIQMALDRALKKEGKADFSAESGRGLLIITELSESVALSGRYLKFTIPANRLIVSEAP